MAKAGRSGPGWLIVLTDALMSNYGMTLHTAYARFPLSAALALWPAMAARNGWEFRGPNFILQASIKARAAMRQHLFSHFTIQEPEPEPETPEISPPPLPL